jgi:hypothetical protein
MKRSLISIVVVAAVAFAAFWAGAYWERNREMPFSATLWRFGGPSQTIARNVDPFRHKMVGDLLAKYLRNGMSKAQVIQLLGEPDNQVEPERQFWYWLNEEFPLGIGIDPKATRNLIVQFDVNGNVETVSHALYRR